ncbi:MAG: adenine nucleotide alpha hydrolase [Chitinophagales bacterium]|nr:adenine nucleotide alpha hydrolase [Chitinophagales bacterium]MDW8418722.1 ATP-binding protein [Chitinophagales bacterium]
MNVPHKTVMHWSSGKDSALALYYLMRDSKYSVEYLLTGINAHHHRVSMHGLRVELLYEQLHAIGIRNGVVLLPGQPDNKTYETLMRRKTLQLAREGFTHAGFGDIYLSDLRQYREQLYNPLHVQCVFPLWHKSTSQLIQEFLNFGFKAITVSVNASLLDETFVGRLVDEDFIKDLPPSIDPCGENGEFHTFCYDGPYFKHPVKFTVGEKVLKEYSNGTESSSFWFCDLIPASD